MSPRGGGVRRDVIDEGRAAGAGVGRRWPWRRNSPTTGPGLGLERLVEVPLHLSVSQWFTVRAGPVRRGNGGCCARTCGSSGRWSCRADPADLPLPGSGRAPARRRSLVLALADAQPTAERRTRAAGGRPGRWRGLPVRTCATCAAATSRRRFGALVTVPRRASVELLSVLWNRHHAAAAAAAFAGPGADLPAGPVRRRNPTSC